MRAAPLLSLMLLGCARGDGGSVVVRWRLVDQATGAAPAGCRAQDRAFCCASLDGAAVIVEAVRLRITPVESASDGAAADIDCLSCRFPCSPLEQATRFEVPPGRYRLSIEALRCDRPIGVTPPGVVREVRAGETTNLGAIEIRLLPGTPSLPACADAGA